MEAMPDERTRILELLREGKITVDEAEQLLDALGPATGRAEPSGGPRPPGAPPPPGEGLSRHLCIRITDLRTGKVKTNIRLPARGWRLLAKLTRTKLGRRLSGLTMQDVQRAAREGAVGHIVDITNDDRDERVEIFLE
jgi:hypothetical protein